MSTMCSMSNFKRLLSMFKSPLSSFKSLLSRFKSPLSSCKNPSRLSESLNPVSVS